MGNVTRNIIHVVLVVCILALGIMGFIKLTASKPRVKRMRPTLPLPVVSVIKVKAGEHQMVITGQGTVQPAKQIDLVPQVAGKVIYVSPHLVGGGQIRKGETLLRIDPTDYELAITLAEAKVKEAESNLEVLLEESSEARAEWAMHHSLDASTAEKPPALLIKEPQIAAARAQLEAAKAGVEREKLNLMRTRLMAPFDGRVDTENVDVGQYVRAGQAIAKLYSIESVEIPVALEKNSLAWFDVPGLTTVSRLGAPVLVKARLAGKEMVWKGRVLRSEGKIDEHTRMVKVIVGVSRPYDTLPPLAVGLFVDAKILGKRLPHVAVIPSWALRTENSVWLVKDGRLVFRKVKVARLEENKAYITGGLNNGDLLVISHHKIATNGMKVRVEMAQWEEQR